MTIKKMIAPFEVELNKFEMPHLYPIKEVMGQIRNAIKFSMAVRMNHSLTIKSRLETIEVSIIHMLPDESSNGHRIEVTLKWTTEYSEVASGECTVIIPCKLEVVMRPISSR